jgi:DtxR family Mn-dependent transcriptional regulator
VERRLVEILGNPTTSPFGNPIPGLRELGGSADDHPASGPAGHSLAAAAQDEPREVTLVRIAERLQADEATMGDLRAMGATPGAHVEVALAAGGGVLLTSPQGSVELSRVQAKQIIVAGE